MNTDGKHRNERQDNRCSCLRLPLLLFLGMCLLLLSLGTAGSVPPGEEATINFSFDQVDIGAFVKLVGEMTGKKFVLAEGVQGKVTVVSPMVSRKEIYPLFVSILESAGCSVVEDSGIYRVIPLPKRDTPAAPVVGADETTPREGVITKVIRLQCVSASEMRKVLEAKVGGGKTGAIAAIDETNHLLITDTAESIRRIEKIIAEIDKPGTARMTEVVPLQFATADDLATQLNVAMAEGETRGEQLKNRLPEVPGSSSSSRRNVIVVPAPHSNSLILVGTQTQIRELKRLIEQMDIDAPTGRGRFNAIFLKYLSASEAATNLNALLMKQAGKPETGPQQKIKIAVEANAANNALIIDASPGDFEVVKKLVEQLDQMPQQVHISVVIAEMSATDGFEFGVELAGMQQPSKVGDYVVGGSSMFSGGAGSLMDSVQQGLFPKGITVGVAYGTTVDSSGKVTASYPGVVNINALKKNSKFNVLSDTSLGVQNNKEATVSVVDEIPVQKSTIQGGSGTSRDVIQNLDRMDVGIKLRLTPHIIMPGGEVQMVLNPSIEAVIDAGPSGAFAPTIARREVSTTYTIPDGKTIVIAGLTRTDTTKMREKIPILGSIPLLGILFRHSVDKVEKTNLLIFVTPRVVTDVAAAEQVMEDLQKKTGLSPTAE
jgi:general secretion pathway protein D